jgi:predicted ester cyclase
MSEERKSAIRNALDQALNEGNVDSLDELYAKDYVMHQPPLPDIVGLDAYKEAIAGARRGLSGLCVTVQEVIVDGDTAAVRWTYEGTHSNHWFVSATGKQVTVVGCTVSHWVDGKIVEEWYYGNILGLMQQLGVVD